MKLRPDILCQVIEQSCTRLAGCKAVGCVAESVPVCIEDWTVAQAQDALQDVAQVGVRSGDEQDAAIRLGREPCG